MNYKQCELRRGDSVTVGWIAEKAAKIGNLVELITADGKFWKVTAVYGTMEEEKLREKQQADRKALPSLG